MDEHEPPEQPAPDASGFGDATPAPAGIYEPPPTPPRGSHAKVTALIVAVLLVITGVGTALVLRASNSESQVDTLIPDTVAAYVKISLKPSVDQQQKFRDLLSRFPSQVRVQAGTKLDDALDQGLKDFGLSYRKDIKPWVGSQIALAVLAPGGATSDRPSTSPTVIGVVPVKDAAAAQKTLDKIKASVPQAPAFEVLGGVVYLGKTTADIDTFRHTVTAGHTLADNASYKREHDRAGGDGLFFAYADLSKIAGFGPALRGDILGGTPLTGTGIVSASLRAEQQGLVLDGHSSGKSAVKGGTFKILPTTPDTLLGSVSFYDLGDLVANALKALSRTFGISPVSTSGQQVPKIPGLSEVTQALKEVEQATGINLQKDLLPWLKGEFTVVVGPVSKPPIPDIGVVIEPTDQAALGRTLKALRTHLGGLLGKNGRVSSDANGFTVATPLGVQIVVRGTASRVVIATGTTYADKLLTPQSVSLADDAVYRATVDPTKPTVFQLFLRLDRIRTLVEGFLKLSSPSSYDDYARNVQPFVTPLQALGIQSTIGSNEQDFRLVLTIAKP